MLYDEKTMLELCAELGIEVVEDSGYSTVNGVEIDPNDIETLFDFPVYSMEESFTSNAQITYDWVAPQVCNMSDIQNVEVPHPMTTVGKYIDDFGVLENSFKYESSESSENICMTLITNTIPELCAA